MSAKAVAIVGLLLVVARSVWASSITVPIGGSIQQALDSDADTVFVHSGVFHERLAINRKVALLPYRATSGIGFDAVPEVDAITVGPPPQHQYTSAAIAGFTILGSLTLPEYHGRDWNDLTVDGCRIDSGVIHVGGPSSVFVMRMRACTIRGDVSVSAWYVEFHHNTVFQGETFLHGEGDLSIGGNSFLDSPGIALRTASGAGVHWITSNYVNGAVVGMQSFHTVHAERNVVLNCKEAGFKGPGSYGDNVVRNCGVGILVEPGSHVFARVSNCTILDCGTGMRILSGEVISGNRVGRCAKVGIDVAGTLLVEGNTVFRNGGSGMVVTSGEITRNIAFENGEYGVEAPESAQLSCNDWFGNATGATAGVLPGDTDLAVDPEFCDVDADDVHLRPSSPLLMAKGCGLIGADSLGCGGATETRDPGGPGTSTGELVDELRLVSAPNPARGGARVVWALPVAANIVLSVVDVQGREVVRLAEGRHGAGRHEVEWRGARPGTYFVRLEVGSRVIAQKLAIIR